MSSHNLPTQVKRHTLRTLQALKDRGEKLTMLTAYDVVTSHFLDRAGLDMILVGDSLGNVVLGFDTTIPVTLDDMIRHTAAVVRGSSRALVILDLPFGTTTDPETALRSAVRAFQETGCQAVKLEGGLHAVAVTQRLTEAGIPVMAHIGLTPQSVHQQGGFRTHGKVLSEADQLKAAARELEKAGAFAIVLECVTADLASDISKTLRIPTIGIGSGPGCDGQVLVINDLIGLSISPPPAFAKPVANVAVIIENAARQFIESVRKPSETKIRLTGEVHEKTDA